MMTESSNLNSLETDVLVTRFAETQMAIEELADHRDRIGYVIQTRMEADEATVLDHPTHDVALRGGRVTYDQSILDGVLEFLGEGALVKRGALIPEHTRLVARQWNATKLAPFAKRGRDVREVLKRARSVGRGLLKITLRECE